MIISLIVAIGKNNEIGKDNHMLCHMPADLKHFKKITSDHTVIMGRKTFDSLPKGPLPNRKNIVISRNKDLKINGVFVYPSIDYALIKSIDEDEVFIIGGAEIYKQTIHDADKLYLTKIHTTFKDADSFFPEIDYKEWKTISQETFPADEKNPHSYTFIELER